MRAVTLADLETALRVLLAAAPEGRAVLARDLLAQADMADAHRARTGCLHPEYGSGTLQSVAQGRGMAPRPAALDADVIGVFALLISEIADFMSHHDD